MRISLSATCPNKPGIHTTTVHNGGCRRVRVLYYTQGFPRFQVKRLYNMFINVDCLQLEVNPLAETPEGKIYTADAKLGFDDNAQYRQKDIFAMEDTTESDPREVEAASFNLNYVQMDGNIGCLVNGAGLAMATIN